MKMEELKKVVFLLEHGYFDDKVLNHMNKTKTDDIDHYEIMNGDMLVPFIKTNTGCITGYGVNSGTYKEMLKASRLTWAKNKIPEISQLIKLGD